MGKFFEAHPDDLGEDAVLQVAGEFSHREKLEIHCAAVAIIVPDVGHARTDRGLDRQFFVQLARQRLLRGLSGSIFPPGNSHCSAMG